MSHLNNPDVAPPDISPQDLGAPSPVPFTLIIQTPSPDLPQAGGETLYLKASCKDIVTVTKELSIYVDNNSLAKFVRDCFDSGYYRLEITLGGTSIKIYKHPNNP